jgi:hypothetical protein
MLKLQTLKKRKANEWIDRLIEITDGTEINDFELKRIEQEARKLLNGPNSQQSDSYEVLGVIAALRQNPAEVRTFFDAAIRLADAESYPVRVSNKVIALQRTYNLRESLEISLSLSERYPDNLDLLQLAHTCALTALKLGVVMELDNRAKALNHSLSVPDDNDNAVDIEPLMNLMGRSGITDNQLLERIEVAASVLEKRKLRFFGNQFFTLSNGESAYKFLSMISPEEAAEVSFEIAEVIIETFDDPLSSVLTISCIPDERYA